MIPACTRWLKKLIRKKTFTEESLHITELQRCLTTMDLVGLGISSTLGSGIYILSGQVAKESAGPAVVLSFAVAGLAAALAGLCYAEFAARVPRAGSAYLFSYVTVGELMAFVIGWNILLEYVITVASVARALSAYIDFTTNNTLQNFFRDNMPIDVPGLSAYPDLFAFGLVLVSAGTVAVGVKESSRINNAFSVVNIVIIIIIIVGGFSKADLHNWNIPKEELPPHGAGSGGFAPFGFSGVMAGAGTCFFAFIGFDFLASMGEEAENPRTAIPRSMMLTLLIDGVAYCAVAAVVTLMWPYFLQDSSAPVSEDFYNVGWEVFAKYVVTAGAVCGMGTSVMSSLFPMTRVVYSMASDGLIFHCLSWISPRFSTPLVGTAVAGLFAGVMAMMFDMIELIHMLSIGTLLAFSLVAVCVLILRYKSDQTAMSDTESNGDVVAMPENCIKRTWLYVLKPCSGYPTPRTEFIAEISIATMCIFSVAFSAVVTIASTQVSDGEGWSIGLTLITAFGIISSCLCLGCQPQNQAELHFKAPFVPILPAASCFINVYLMFKLNTATWIRFGVWMAVGFCIYFFYGQRHSSLNDSEDEDEEKAQLTSSFRFNSLNHYTIRYDSVLNQEVPVDLPEEEVRLTHADADE